MVCFFFFLHLSACFQNSYFIPNIAALVYRKREKKYSLNFLIVQHIDETDNSQTIQGFKNAGHHSCLGDVLAISIHFTSSSVLGVLRPPFLRSTCSQTPFLTPQKNIPISLHSPLVTLLKGSMPAHRDVSSSSPQGRARPPLLWQVPPNLFTWMLPTLPKAIVLSSASARHLINFLSLTTAQHYSFPFALSVFLTWALGRKSRISSRLERNSSV